MKYIHSVTTVSRQEMTRAWTRKMVEMERSVLILNVYWKETQDRP